MQDRFLKVQASESGSSQAVVGNRRPCIANVAQTPLITLSKEIRRKHMAQTIYASFADASLAEKAAGALLDYGVRNEDISLVSRERGTEDETSRRDYTAHSATLAEREGTTTYADRTTDTDYTDRDSNTTVIDHSTGQGDRTELAAKQGLSTTTPGDAAAGAAKGAGIGLGVGVLAALASLVIPGFGLVVGGGALATALAGAAGATAAGAVAGGVHGYLKDQGVPDQVAMDYDHAVKTGGAVLAVSVPSGDMDEATCREILAKYNANNVNSYGAMAA